MIKIEKKKKNIQVILLCNASASKITTRNKTVKPSGKDLMTTVIEIGKHLTRLPAEMDMIFIPNYLTEFGKKIILSRENEFISLMLIFGHIKLLQSISLKLNFSINSEIQKLK